MKNPLLHPWKKSFKKKEPTHAEKIMKQIEINKKRYEGLKGYARPTKKD